MGSVVNESQVVVNRRGIAAVPEGEVEVGYGAVPAVLLEVEQATIEQGRQVRRIEFDRTVIVVHRVIMLTQRGVSERAVIEAARDALGADDNQLVVRNSIFEDLFADGGGGENDFDDRGGNDFDDLDLPRFEEA